MSVEEGEGGTPFAIHPTWCATTMLYEQALPRAVRELGAEVLLFHDRFENTKAPMPKRVQLEVVKFVKFMTFQNHDDEVAKFSSRGDTDEEKRLLRLFSLYDKTSSLMHARWSTRADHYAQYALDLLTRVEQDGWGSLNIFVIARALAAKVLAEFDADQAAN